MSLFITHDQLISHYSIRKYLALTAVSDDNLLGGLSRAGAKGFHLLKKIHAVDKFTKNNVLAIEPWAGDGGQEKLRAIGVWTSIGHREETGSGVLVLEAFILKLFTVDAFTTGTITAGEVTTLAHKLGNDTEK